MPVGVFPDLAEPHHTDRLNRLHEAAPMPQTPIQNTRNKIARMYGAGILVFTVIVGSISAVVIFIANVTWN
jgi:hypothetical protein